MAFYEPKTPPKNPTPPGQRLTVDWRRRPPPPLDIELLILEFFVSRTFMLLYALVVVAWVFLS